MRPSANCPRCGAVLSNAAARAAIRCRACQPACRRGMTVLPWLAGAGAVVGLALATVALVIAFRADDSPPEPAPAAESIPAAPAAVPRPALTIVARPTPVAPPPEAATRPGVLKRGGSPSDAGQARAAPDGPVGLVRGEPARAEPKRFPRRNHLSEETLRQQLARAEEVGLGRSGAGLLRAYTTQGQKGANLSGSKGAADASLILKQRPDLRHLPFRDGPTSTLPVKAAVELGALSRKLRAYFAVVAPADQEGRRDDADQLRQRLFQDLRGKRREWLRPEAVPTLTQMLVAEDGPTRRTLVDLLAAIPGRAATVALARRAVFDLDAPTRAAAVEALRGRPGEQWRPVLLGALRYPWPPPADFAAEALAHLGDQAALPELIDLLAAPAPGRPQVGYDKRIVIREVVRVHHQENCLLCHARASRGDEPVLGVGPVWQVPTPLYANRQPGGAGQGKGKDYGGKRRVGTVGVPTQVLVRADITFLRQDFSIALPGPKESVRFDYLIRTRPVTPAERKRWEAIDEEDTPQREAALFALRHLTGQDHGDDTQAWVRAFPLAEAELRAARLAERVVRAEMRDRGALLLKYRDAAGVEHAWALRQVIPRLSGPAQEVARRALAARLDRLPSVAELRQRLRHADAEQRRSAVLACLERGGRDTVAGLLALLDDPDTQALARDALRKLTGRILPSAEAYRDWWARQGGGAAGPRAAS